MYQKTSQEFFKSFLKQSFLRVSCFQETLKKRFRKRSGNAQETPGNVQETFWKRAGNAPETLRPFSQGMEAIQETFRKRLGNVQETLRKRSGNVVETLKKRSRKLLKNVWKRLETFFQETLKKRLGSFLVQLSIYIYIYIEVRDSRMGYLVPGRDGPVVWPDGRVVGAPSSPSSPSSASPGN